MHISRKCYFSIFLCLFLWYGFVSYKCLSFDILPEVHVRTSPISVVHNVLEDCISMVRVKSTVQASAEVKVTSSLLAEREFVPPCETWLCSSVAVLSKQHGDTQWWEMSTASYIPPQRSDFKAMERFQRSMYLNGISTSLSKWHIRHFCICIYH